SLPQFARKVLESLATKIVVDGFGLAIADVQIQALNFRVDVAARHKDIRPAVVVEVKEAASPAQIPGIGPEPGRERYVVVKPVACVVIERCGVFGEVRLEDIEPAF